MNIDSKIQQIISLGNNGQYLEMEKACRQLLKKRPVNFDGLQFLGLALSKQDRQEEAVSYFKKALKISSNHIGVLNNLSYAYNEIGKYQEALTILQKAIKIDPTKASVYNNLGTALFRTKQYDQALKAYNKSLKLEPHIAQAVDNVGVCLKKMGRVQESIDHHLQANNLDPQLACVYVNLMKSLTTNHVTDDALHVAMEGLKVATTPSPERLELLVGVAITAWLTGQLDLARDAIQQSQFVMSEPYAQSTKKSIAGARPFHIYIKSLLQARLEQPDLYTTEAELPLFFVGESHCLSPSETVVAYQGQNYRVLSTLIEGCKAWHLGLATGNEYKTSLDIIFRSLPQESKIVVGMGEIDCRPDEGIFPAYLEKNIDFRISIPEIIEKYVGYVSKTAKPYNHELLFYGVPAPTEALLATMEPESKNLLMEIIRLFNDQLKRLCQSKGWSMLDVLALTTNDEGAPDNQFHIDSNHLHPRALGVLFQSHLITPEANSRAS